MATLNRAAYIGETLDSLISQLEESVEIVVLDGGSTDGTRELLTQYAQRCPQLRYVRQEAPGGTDRDFDRSVELASGRYCWLTCDDDVLKIGGLASVLATLKRNPSLVVVNTDARTIDLSQIIVPRRLRFDADREYGSREMSRLLEETGFYLTYIGCIVIRRDLWLQRERRAYYGSLFIHVGVIFQQPLPETTLVLAYPWITSRMGNATWSAREFEIWLFKWPTLVWSLPVPTDESKAVVSSLEPWREIARLVFFRGKGSYSLDVYNKFIRPRPASIVYKFIARAVAIMPGALLNALGLLYLRFIRSDKAPGDRALGIYDMRQSPYYWRNKIP